MKSPASIQCDQRRAFFPPRLWHSGFSYVRWGPALDLSDSRRNLCASCSLDDPGPRGFLILWHLLQILLSPPLAPSSTFSLFCWLACTAGLFLCQLCGPCDGPPGPCSPCSCAPCAGVLRQELHSNDTRLASGGGLHSEGVSWATVWALTVAVGGGSQGHGDLGGCVGDRVQDSHSKAGSGEGCRSKQAEGLFSRALPAGPPSLAPTPGPTPAQFVFLFCTLVGS